MGNNIGQIENELEEARQDLHQTVTEVNQKVEAVATHLQPEHLVERHPLLSVCIAGALGFALGNRESRGLGFLVLGGLLGVTLSEVWNDRAGDRDTTAAA